MPTTHDTGKSSTYGPEHAGPSCGPWAPCGPGRLRTRLSTGRRKSVNFLRRDDDCGWTAVQLVSDHQRDRVFRVAPDKPSASHGAQGSRKVGHGWSRTWYRPRARCLGLSSFPPSSYSRNNHKLIYKEKHHCPFPFSDKLGKVNYSTLDSDLGTSLCYRGWRWT